MTSAPPTTQTPPLPPVERPALWAKHDAEMALRRLETDPRYTHCGKPTKESGEYVEEIRRIIKLARVG